MPGTQFTQGRLTLLAALGVALAACTVAVLVIMERGRDSQSSDRGQVIQPSGSIEEEARRASALAGFEVKAPVLPAGFQLTGVKVDAPENGPIHEVSMAFKGPFPISITQSSAPVVVTGAETLPSPLAGAELVRARSEFGFTGYTLITKTRSYELLVETKFGMDEGEIAKVLVSMVK